MLRFRTLLFLLASAFFLPASTLHADDGYRLTGWRLDGAGNCLSCGTACPGVFDGPPGTWGSRRQRVHLGMV